ncbi:MAG: sugar phosphate isomerase/epimerase, partial [Bryobacterales bacterium]|nr:sugar phosphate isomerase/epimerase [Bryobacterales bacterium]
MPIAFQTICLGDRLRKEDWPQFLDAVRAAGYDGVEVFQEPNQLPKFEELRSLANERKLTILGFSGGNLASRMSYLRPEGKRVVAKGEEEPYLYVEHWRELDGEENVADRALAQGFQLALHYHHLSKLTKLEEARKLLKAHPALKWLPDTAHLFIGSQDTKKVLATLCDRFFLDRTIAIHLKDWTPIYGRFSHRFARGFCLPGDGDVGLESLVKSPEFKGCGVQWKVLELDYALTNPMRDMYQSALTLHKWGCLGRVPQPSEFRPGAAASSEKVQFPFELLLALASRADHEFYFELADLLRRETNAAQVFICSIITSSGEATIRARAESKGVSELTRDEVKEFAKKVADQRDICEERIPSQPEAELKLVAVPVLNPFNPNLIRQVIIYRAYADQCFNKDLATSKRLRGCVGDAVDIFVAERCLKGPAQTTQLANRVSNRTELLTTVAQLLKESLNCQGVTIFLATHDGRLFLGGTTGLVWNRDSRRYLRGEGLTGKTVANRSYRIYRHEKGRQERMG